MKKLRSGGYSVYSVGHPGCQNGNLGLHTQYGFQTVPAGTNQAINPRMTNEFLFNYSRSNPNSFLTLDNFGGAVPPPNSVLFPSFAPQYSNFLFFGGMERSVNLSSHLILYNQFSTVFRGGKP